MFSDILYNCNNRNGNTDGCNGDSCGPLAANYVYSKSQMDAKALVSFIAAAVFWHSIAISEFAWMVANTFLP